MRRFPPGALRPFDGAPTLSEFHAPNDREPLVTMGMLGRLGLLLLIIFGFAMAAQFLVGAPH
jgi:hypothetical protein